MFYIPILISALEVIVITIPVLLSVAFVTVAERKVMASMQRRLGPNIVGYYGLLQAFADALKLLLKEYVSPTQANIILFFIGPIITLIFSLLGYAVIPFSPGLSLFDFNLGILFMLAVSSLATYGILLAGWSANSKYAFLGSLRSTAQLISYELVLSSVIFVVILLTSSLNLTVNIEAQKSVWFIAPLFPMFIIFFIASIAETNRAPFDLAEAESELVSGFMTEHSAVVFVFFFLAEYASIVLICILISILFTGGYLIDFALLIFIGELIHSILFYILSYFHVSVDIVIEAVDNFVGIVDAFLDLIEYGSVQTVETIKTIDILDCFYGSVGSDLNYLTNNNINSIIFNINKTTSIWTQELNNGRLYQDVESMLSDSKIENLIYGLVIAIKSFIMIFVFIWVRASLPRIRYDQLMSYCWTVLLPIVFAFIVTLPCLLYILEIMPNNILFF